MPVIISGFLLAIRICALELGAYWLHCIIINIYLLTNFKCKIWFIPASNIQEKLVWSFFQDFVSLLYRLLRLIEKWYWVRQLCKMVVFFEHLGTENVVHSAYCKKKELYDILLKMTRRKFNGYTEKLRIMIKLKIEKLNPYKFLPFFYR